jgi:hypothetical protein
LQLVRSEKYFHLKWLSEYNFKFININVQSINFKPNSSDDLEFEDELLGDGTFHGTLNEDELLLSDEEGTIDKIFKVSQFSKIKNFHNFFR